MKKSIKLVLALVLSVMMIAGMIPAMAAEAYDESVTVSGLTNGDVAHFYKIVEWVDNAAGNVKGWAVKSPFSFDLEAVLLGTKATQADVDAGKAAKVGDYIADTATGITSTLANTLAAQAQAGAAANPATVTPVDVIAASGAATLDTTATGRGPGIYMALITPADSNIVYNPVFVSSDYTITGATNTNAKTLDELVSYTDEGAAKKSTTTLDKTASTDEVAPDDVKWQTTAIGDTVHFTVTTTIPGFGKAFVSPYFKMTDQLTDLKLVANSVKIKSPDAAKADGAATITEASNGLSYDIVFAANYLKTVTVPTLVTVEYDAIVTNTAPYHVNREKNEVWTEYSHDINNEEDHEFKKDTTQHYTFTLDADTVGYGGSGHGEKTSEIVKVGVKEDGTPITQTTEHSEITDSNTWKGPLAGAKFKLYRDSRCRDEDEYIPKTTAGAPGTALNIVSGDDGRMTIAGLDAGEYWLKETEAPAGFVKDSHIAHIVITAVTSSKNVTEYTTDGVTWISAEAYTALPYGTDEEKDAKDAYKSYTYATETLDSYTVTIDDHDVATYTFQNKGNEVEIDWTEHPPVELPHQFVNTKGVELPSTGGIGTTIFYIGGSILVLAAAILLITKRRMGAGE